MMNFVPSPAAETPESRKFANQVSGKQNVDICHQPTPMLSTPARSMEHYSKHPLATMPPNLGLADCVARVNLVDTPDSVASSSNMQ